MMPIKSLTLIKPFDPWKGKLCTCPAKYSLSAYTGCSHGCLYCYASSYIKDFFFSREKKDFLKRLRREIKKLPKNSLITMANSSDPYLALERKNKLTRQALAILKNSAHRIMLVTKSSLILRDLDILKDGQKVIVSVSLTTLNEKLAKRLEPAACPPKERLKIILTLSKYIPVVVRFDPLIYPLNTGEIKVLVKEVSKSGAKQIITSTYKAKPDNLRRMFGQFPEYKKLWERLYLIEASRQGRYLYLPISYRKKLIEEVRAAALSHRLAFSSCREELAYLNTKPCDGSGFF